jgi:hypothetical protein
MQKPFTAAVSWCLLIFFFYCMERKEISPELTLDTLVLQDLKRTWRLNVIKRSLVIICVSMEWLSDVSDTVWTSIIRDLCDESRRCRWRQSAKDSFVENLLSRRRYLVEIKWLFYIKYYSWAYLIFILYCRCTCKIWTPNHSYINTFREFVITLDYRKISMHRFRFICTSYLFISLVDGLVGT